MADCSWLVVSILVSYVVGTGASSAQARRIHAYCDNMHSCGMWASSEEMKVCARQRLVCRLAVNGAGTWKRIIKKEELNNENPWSSRYTDSSKGIFKIPKRFDSEDLSPSFFRLL